MQLSTKEQQRLKHKYGEWAIVTGASSGIGLELARVLANAGFNLIINARNLEHLESVAKDLIRKHPIKIKIVDADLSESSGVEKIIESAQDLNVGLLINNAGFGTSGLFVKSSLQTEINMFRVNCEAVLSLTHYFSKTFKQQQRGGIIFLSSLVAFQGVPYAANYAATKAYIQSFAEALAIEFKPFGIDVLSAAPGPVNSGFGERAGMNMNKTMDASAISIPILKAIGRSTNVVPGLLSKILVYSLRTVPRWAKVRIMKQVMFGFVKG